MTARTARGRGTRALVTAVGAIGWLALFGAPGTPLRAQRTLAAPASPASPALVAARGALRAGRYDEAISAFRALSRSGTGPVAATRGLVRALMEVGRYEEAESAARAAAASSPEALNALGEVLAARGKREAAEQTFRLAIERGASDRLVAELNLAVLLRERGDRAAAKRAFDRFIDVYNSGQRLGAAELAAVGTAVRWLGEDDPQLYKDALRAYDEAAAADTLELEPRLLAGELFLDRYNGADAQKSFREVLAVNPRQPRALLDMARVLQFDAQPGAAESARKALETNPNLVPAHLFLARLAAAGEAWDTAQAEVGRALEVDPASRDALAVLGAIREMRGDRAGFEEARRRAFALDPKDADFFCTAAEMSVQGRRYRAAAELARRALGVDPESPRALGILGLNQLRLGLVNSARASLEAAFTRDPYNVWYKNTLDLLDTFKDYRDVRTPDFELVINGKEADLLAPYAEALAEEAYRKLAARYGYRPRTPVRIEIYPRHADFSVRTVGLVGLGALGVTFGRVVAMDSPAAREPGDFNWGSTLWHEMAHVFHLGMTDARVPRWFTEGLAVYEERRARPGWGFMPDPGWLAAFQAGRLAPVSRLNDGFVRPTYPEQVVHSYYEASLVVELIEQEHGRDALLRMLHAYARGDGDAKVFREVLGVEPGAFDRTFDRYVRQRFASALGAGFVDEMRRGTALRQAGQGDAAAAHLERAKALFPDYAGPGSAYALLARIHEQRGEIRQAADELTALVARNESAYGARLALDTLLERLGDRAGAAAALDGALYIWPYDATVHGHLAELYAGLADRGRAVRERRAVVALAPADRAEALYQLALALYQAGDAAGARTQVLRSLEAAPDFQKAQALLLRLHAEERP